MKKLILVSTFRHLFLGLNLAIIDTDSEYHVLFIDQKLNEDVNTIFKVAKSILKPFSSIAMLPVKQGTKSKKAHRKTIFNTLELYLNELTPDEIITGNDRRLEFQFSMKYCRSNINPNVLGSYIDDGTGSYRNMYSFNKLSKYTDKFIDTPLKKLVYGQWYTRPETLGASHWVSKCYLTFPELALNEIKMKAVKLDAEIYTSFEGQRILDAYMNGLNCMQLSKGAPSVLFVLPHSSIIDQLYGDKENLIDKLAEIIKEYPNAFVKYHPREVGDPLYLKEKVNMLPAEVPAELFLAFFRFDRVLGDVSTALMSARWLQPSCKVEYLPNASKHTRALLSIFKSIDVSPYTLNI
jgi:hypothetical protein